MINQQSYSSKTPKTTLAVQSLGSLSLYLLNKKRMYGIMVARAGKMENQEISLTSRFKRRELPRCKRALSPIFATLIILAVVTVLFIPVFIWATGLTSQNQESWDTSSIIATERIVVEEINLKSGTRTCIIYVRNIGTTAVTISSVLISRADGTGQISTFQRNALNFDVDHDGVIQGDLMTITIADLGFSPAPATTYNIKVVTTRGVNDQYQAVT